MAVQKERLAKKAGIEIGVKIFTCAWQRKIKCVKKRNCFSAVNMHVKLKYYKLHYDEIES